MGNLPQETGLFVGRAAEVDQARKYLAQHRIVTLTGVGGVGKTQMALRIASRSQQTAPLEASRVDLGTLRVQVALAPAPPEQLYLHMVVALGIWQTGAKALDVLIEHLSRRRTLLVLDNCDRLIAPARTAILTLTRAVPHLRILATSRQALGIEGERIVAVAPLPSTDAVELFTSTATAAGVDLTHTDAAALEALCNRLDCLPLAIRLAAARARSLSVSQLLQRVDDRFRLLALPQTTSHGPGGERHATLERVVQMSYELCTAGEQRLWARLSVFAQPFDLPTAEAVCAGDGLATDEIVDLIAGLVEKSVLAVEAAAPTATGNVRYVLLNTIRDYGSRELDNIGETTRIRDRHRLHFHTRLASAASRPLGPQDLDTLTALRRELPDILAALHASLAQSDYHTAHAIARDVVRTRVPFYWGLLDLISSELGTVIDATRPSTTTDGAAVELASTLAVAAWVATTQGHFDAARSLLAEANTLHTRTGTPPSRWCSSPPVPASPCRAARQMPSSC